MSSSHDIFLADGNDGTNMNTVYFEWNKVYFKSNTDTTYDLTPHISTKLHSYWKKRDRCYRHHNSFIEQHSSPLVLLRSQYEWLKRIPLFWSYCLISVLKYFVHII